MPSIQLRPTRVDTGARLISLDAHMAVRVSFFLGFLFACLRLPFGHRVSTSIELALIWL